MLILDLFTVHCFISINILCPINTRVIAISFVFCTKIDWIIFIIAIQQSFLKCMLSKDTMILTIKSANELVHNKLGMEGMVGDLE